MQEPINTTWDRPPQVPNKPFFPTGRREWIFGAGLLLTGWLLCSSVIFGGFNLGFAVCACIAAVLSIGYLLCAGCRLRPYSGALLGLSLVLAAAFVRSDDAPVKFMTLCFLVLGVNLGLCLLSGQSRRDPGRLQTLWDAPRALLALGLGKLPEAVRGLQHSSPKGGTAARKSGLVLLGLVIALPIVCLLVVLLMRADAAFEAVLDRLPSLETDGTFSSILLGTGLAMWLYTRGTALRHAPKMAPVGRKTGGISPLTVNTVLAAVGAVYLVYLLSQLAYFSGGLSGILPEEFTLAEYARRGFFEMAWLCGVNLAVMALSAGLVTKAQKTPLTTKLLSLFLGIVTLFLVVTASAKMLLYIRSFGLTRLRVLTEVVMVFLGITTALVTVWLFVPKMPYMKAVLLVAFVMMATVAWADVDTVVARYNVEAYQSGALESVDIIYLNSLGDGAVTYIAELADDADETVAAKARELLSYRYAEKTDLRGWNMASGSAAGYLPEAPEEAGEQTQWPEDCEPVVSEDMP